MRDDLRRAVDALGRRTPLLHYTGIAYRAELEKATGDGERGYVVPPKADKRLVC